MILLATMILRPFALLIILWLICWPIKRFTWNHMPACRLKRVLFYSWRV